MEYKNNGVLHFYWKNAFHSLSGGLQVLIWLSSQINYYRVIQSPVPVELLHVWKPIDFIGTSITLSATKSYFFLI